MKTLSKEYKKQVKKSYNKYIKTIHTSFNKLKKEGKPRDYWDLLNSTKNKGKRQKSKCPLKDLYEYFKELNSTNTQQAKSPNPSPTEEPHELDESINNDEIKESISKLKNNKAQGIDNISNEYIKSTQDLMIPIYNRLFNLIYTSGVMPTSWCTGIIKPIYKKKGAAEDPNNYRPITLLSCLGKVFTSILNARLNKYVEQNEILREEQLGFRPGYSTIDGIFILDKLIEIINAKNKTIFAAFIDLAKAFPSISHPILTQKIEDLKIGKQMTNIIKSMYNNIKSCVSTDGQISPLFPCQIGVLEGEILSPILYSLFTNDLFDYVNQNYKKGIVIESIGNDITYFLKLFFIMYVDDTVLLAESKADLQEILNIFTQYCQVNNLNINIGKTKVMTIGKYTRKPKCYINGKELEVVNNFKYLGVTVTKTGKYKLTIKDNIEKARRAFYAQIRTVKENHIPLNCHIDLFNKTIEPILLYGVEIWGHENFKQIEQFRLRCLKTILNLRSSTPDYMIYGELGLRPLEEKAKIRMINYWGNLIMGKQTKISTRLYMISRQTSQNVQPKHKWNSAISKILDDVGFSYLWLIEHPQTEYLNRRTEIKQRILDQSEQTLLAEPENHKKRNYSTLIKERRLSPYFEILDQNAIFGLLKFRTSNHRLPVEVGRYRNIEYKDRKCPDCKTIGDEFHYLFSCELFKEERKRLIPKYFRNRPNMIKYEELMNSKNKSTLIKLTKFIKIIVNKVK